MSFYMEPGQFQLPTTPEITRRTDEAFGVHPESDPLVDRLKRVKVIERDVERLRAEADPTIIPRDAVERIVRFVTGRAPEEDIERRLVDIEREEGGALLASDDGAKRGFWYHDGRWLYDEQLPTERNTHVVQYDIDPETGIAKLHRGRPVPLERGEAENLLDTIPLYYERIQTNIYDQRRAA
jgi:hypothetical protein